jgi:hypothetical protein
MQNRESSGPAGEVPLLERERELGLLADALERAAAGDARVVMVEGEPGVGKTSLLEWVGRRAAQDGFTVLRARGGSLERTLGWGVARQLFEIPVMRAAPSTRRALLRGSAALASPVLGFGGEPSHTAGGLVKDFSLEHGLYWLVSNLTERSPLALLIDDAQWCDEATLEWLVYLARRCEQLPLLVVLATRTGEPDAPSALLELIASEPVTASLRLSALGLEGTEALLQRAYGSMVDGSFGRACYEWTGGNPLFVTELAIELTAEGIDPV